MQISKERIEMMQTASQSFSKDDDDDTHTNTTFEDEQKSISTGTGTHIEINKTVFRVISFIAHKQRIQNVH